MNHNPTPERNSAALEQAMEVANACNTILEIGGPEEWGAMAHGGSVGLQVKIGSAGTVFLLNSEAERLLVAASGGGANIPPWAFAELERAVAAGTDPRQAIVRIASRLQPQEGGWVWGVSGLQAGSRGWIIAKVAVVPAMARIVARSPPRLDSGAVAYLANLIGEAGV